MCDLRVWQNNKHSTALKKLPTLENHKKGDKHGGMSSSPPFPPLINPGLSGVVHQFAENYRCVITLFFEITKDLQIQFRNE